MTTLEQRSRSSSGCSSSSYSHRHCPVALSFNRTAGRRISCAAQPGPVSAHATLLGKRRCVFYGMWQNDLLGLHSIWQLKDRE